MCTLMRTSLTGAVNKFSSLLFNALTIQHIGLLCRYGLLLLIAAGSLLWMMNLEPIQQSLEYHEFADARMFVGISNSFDVLSNLPFLLVGLLGIRFFLYSPPGAESAAWMVMFLGLGLVSIGSTYYHLDPDNDSLLWDRLPMTVGFMGLLSALLGEYVNHRLGRILLVPALALGIASVVLWAMTDDLRLYLWVQLIPLLCIPVLMLIFHSRYTHQWMLLIALGWYVLAKLAEIYDLAMFTVTQGLISGHTIKHMLAAAGCYSILVMLRNRRLIAQPQPPLKG
jgi:hypothetical protein